MQNDLRERIVDVASEMMRRRGYADVDVTEVCRASGVARAQFYRTFDGKRGLGVAVVERFSEERSALLDRALHPEMPIRGQIQRMFSMLHQEQRTAFEETGRVPGSYFTLFVDLSEEEQVLRSAVDEALDAWRGRLAAAIEAASARGEVKLPDPTYPATAIIAFAEGALQLARTLNRPDIMLELAPASMSLLIDRRATGSWPMILLSSGAFPTVGSKPT